MDRIERGMIDQMDDDNVTTDEDSVNDTAVRLLDHHGKVPAFIDDLEDAVQVVDGIRTLVTDKNGHVVVEKWMNIGGKSRWLGTDVYRVIHVNVQTGDVTLLDEGLRQSAQTNFLTAPGRGWRFKVPVPKLNLKKRSKGAQVDED